MTAQIPERFVNRHPRIDLGWLKLFFVSGDLPVEPIRPDDKWPCTTALWRNYVGTWLLCPDGRLQLTQFEFPYVHGDQSVIQPVENGYMTGDFTMTLRPFFTGPSTTIPFLDGRVVEDRSNWEIDETIYALVERVCPSGLYCDCGFIPSSTMPSDLRSDLQSAIGKQIRCKIIQIDRGNIILAPLARADGSIVDR